VSSFLTLATPIVQRGDNHQVSAWQAQFIIWVREINLGLVHTLWLPVSQISR
jgi:hypothetical protein